MYDLIIIGAGPAGLTASIYSSRYKISHLIIGELYGGMVSECHKICNYPSEVDINGMELTNKMLENVKAQGGELIPDRVEEIVRHANSCDVKTLGGKVFESKRILLAIGTSHKKLGVTNEDEYLGKGLTYCATCDGMFYKDKIVAVVGGANSAMISALYMSDIAQKVFLIVRGNELKGDEVNKSLIQERANITVIFNTTITEIIGEGKVSGIKLSQTYQNKEIIELSGIIVSAGAMPSGILIKQLGLKTDENGYVVVDQEQKTSVGGVWASGDITTASNKFRQIVTACAEGAVASESIARDKRVNR